MHRYDFCGGREAIRIRGREVVGVRIVNPLIVGDDYTAFVEHDGVPRILTVPKEPQTRFQLEDLAPAFPDLTLAFELDAARVIRGRADLRMCENPNGVVLVKLTARGDADSVLKYLRDKGIDVGCAVLPCKLRISSGQSPVHRAWNALQKSSFHATWESETRVAQYQLLPCTEDDQEVTEPIVSANVDRIMLPAWQPALRRWKHFPILGEILDRYAALLSADMQGTCVEVEIPRWHCGTSPQTPMLHNTLENPVLLRRLDVAYENALLERLLMLWRWQKQTMVDIMTVVDAILDTKTKENQAVCKMIARAVAATDYEVTGIVRILEVIRVFEIGNAAATEKRLAKHILASTAAVDRVSSANDALMQSSLVPSPMEDVKLYILQMVQEAWTGAGWLARLPRAHRKLLTRSMHGLPRPAEGTDGPPLRVMVECVYFSDAPPVAPPNVRLYSPTHGVWYTAGKSSAELRTAALRRESNLVLQQLQFDRCAAVPSKMLPRNAEVILRMRAALDHLELDDYERRYANSVIHLAALYGWKVVAS